MVTGHRFWRGDWQSLGHKEVGDWEALSATRGGRAASWVWEQQDHSPLERPLDPQGEMGMQWLDRCTWSGRGSRLEMSLESLQEEERPGGGMWVIADSTRVTVVQSWWNQLRARKDWLSGAQLLSLFL